MDSSEEIRQVLRIEYMRCYVAMHSASGHADGLNLRELDMRFCLLRQPSVTFEEWCAKQSIGADEEVDREPTEKEKQESNTTAMSILRGEAKRCPKLVKFAGKDKDSKSA